MNQEEGESRGQTNGIRLSRKVIREEEKRVFGMDEAKRASEKPAEQRRLRRGSCDLGFVSEAKPLRKNTVHCF